jgi:hypothetical protein
MYGVKILSVFCEVKLKEFESCCFVMGEFSLEIKITANNIIIIKVSFLCYALHFYTLKFND